MEGENYHIDRTARRAKDLSVSTHDPISIIEKCLGVPLSGNPEGHVNVDADRSRRTGADEVRDTLKAGPIWADTLDSRSPERVVHA